MKVFQHSFAATLAVVCAGASFAALAVTDSDVERIKAEGYELVGSYHVDHWYDSQGNEVDDGCESGGSMALSNGQTLTCDNSGMTPSREATVLKNGNYYRVLVGVDTIQAHY